MRSARFISSLIPGFQEFLSLILLLVTLGIVFRCIEESRWITPQPSFILVLGLAALTGFLLSKSRLTDTPVTLLFLASAFAVIVWQASAILPPPEAPIETNGAFAAARSLWEAVVLGKPGTIYFSIFLILFTWLTGYVSTWSLVKEKNAWIAVILGTIAILVNLKYYTDEHYGYFFFFLLAALLLLVQTGLIRRNDWFRRGNTRRYPVRAALSVILCGTILSTAVAAGAWFLPKVRADHVRTVISNKLPWVNGEDVARSWVNVFAAVEAKQSVVTSTDLETLSFAGYVDLRKDVRFVVTSPKRPSYWRTRRYDTYESWGWSSKHAGERALSRGTPLAEAESLRNRTRLTYTVENKSRADVLLIAGEFLSSDVSVSLHTFTDTFGIEEIVTVMAPRLLDYSERYTVTSSISTVPSAELSKAGGGYPRSITARYLQLPSRLPERVKQVARTIARRSQTPYDTVQGVISYLSQLSYLESGTFPPEGVDGVDHFLFTSKRGNCTNFASAAVVLLRSAGIPSRLAAGYIPREWDKATGSFTIRAKDYHAWPEVYFPGYGWIEFEATPGIGNPGEGTTPNGASPTPIGTDTTTADSPAGTSNETTPAQDSTTNFPGSQDSTYLDPFGMDLIDSSPARQGLALPFALLVTVLLLMATGIVLYRRFWRFSAAGYACQAYARMCLLASLSRLGPRAQQTPLEYSRGLALALPSQAEAVNNITHAYLEDRYSQKKEHGAEDRERLHRSWRAVSRALVKRLLFRRITTPSMKIFPYLRSSPYQVRGKL